MALKKKPVTGMKDILPEEMKIRDYVISVIKETYGKFGFTPIETPCVEHIENLNSKQGGENEKLIFKVLKRGEKLKLEEAKEENDMINRLHYEMIRLYSGDPMRIQHFCKVHSYAKLIAEMEHVDASTLFILEAAALTHDIGIHLCEEKYGSSNGKLQEKEGPAIAEKLLKELQFEENVIERVKYLIAHHHTYDAIDGIDYQILVEADFLVNILEDGLAKEAALQAYQNIFKTESGKNICQEMFAL